jgi:hypothetical protein
MAIGDGQPGFCREATFLSLDRTAKNKVLKSQTQHHVLHYTEISIEAIDSGSNIAILCDV